MDYDEIIGTGVLAWAGWVSIVLIGHIKALAGIRKNCITHLAATAKTQKHLADLVEAITRIDRNIVRLGQEAGMDPGLESPPTHRGD